MPEGYCTVDDVRQALQETGLNWDEGVIGEDDHALVVNRIAAKSIELEKDLKRHWYAEADDAILADAEHVTIPESPKTRDDEYSIPTGAAHIAGEDPTPKTSQGSYAKIDLARRDAESVSKLLVRTADGSFEDWSEVYAGGSYPDALGDDYYLRVNNGGWSRLYLDVTNLLEEDEDDEYVLDDFANCVYLEFAYGHAGIPENVRSATAMYTGAQLLAPDDEASLGIPENASLQAVETKVSALERQADELLEVYK